MMHNTNEMVWIGTHVRTAPFSKAVYDTEATEVVIHSWNDVFASQASAAEIGVYVDGVYLQSVNATAMGAATHTVVLPAGPKRVEIVINGYRGPTPNNIPSLIGPGIWLSRLEFNAPAMAVPSPTKRGVVIIGDSIANGSKLASAVREAYPRLLQANVDFPINVIGRGGLSLYDITTALGTQTNFRPTKLVREVIAYNPQLVIFALGYNDAARNEYLNAPQYAAAIDAVASEIATYLPGVEMGAMTMLHTTNPPGFYYWNIRDGALQCTKAVGFAAPTLLDSDLEDGVHPNAGGHAKIAAVLAPFVNARAMPSPVMPSFVTQASSDALDFYFTREGKTFNAGDGYQSAQGPNWYTRKDTTVPGDLYVFRMFLEAGSATPFTGTGNPAFGVWSSGRISAPRGFSFGPFGNFRVRFEIALPNQTQNILGTYHIWRGAGMAPTP